MRRRKSPIGPLDYLRRWPLQAWLAMVTVFLYAPLITLMAFSFNNSRRNIVWKGFTLDYYKMALTDASLLEAFGNSLAIAAISTVVSLVLGALAALVLWRFRFTGKTALDGALALPIVAPEICMGVAMLVFFARVLPWPQDLPWPLNLGAIIISHISFSFPFVAVVVRARMASFNREMEEAARDLGAGPFETFRLVTLPLIMPGIFGAAMLAFALSIDDFVISNFNSGTTVTFPLYIFGAAQRGIPVEVNVIAMILFFFTCAAMGFATWQQRRAEKLTSVRPEQEVGVGAGVPAGAPAAT